MSCRVATISVWTGVPIVVVSITRRETRVGLKTHRFPCMVWGKYPSMTSRINRRCRKIPCYEITQMSGDISSGTGRWILVKEIEEWRCSVERVTRLSTKATAKKEIPCTKTIPSYTTCRSFWYGATGFIEGKQANARMAISLALTAAVINRSSLTSTVIIERTRTSGTTNTTILTKIATNVGTTRKTTPT